MRKNFYRVVMVGALCVGVYTGFQAGVRRTKEEIRKTVNQAIADNRKELQVEMKQSVKEGMTEALEEQFDRLPPWLRSQIKDK